MLQDMNPRFDSYVRNTGSVYERTIERFRRLDLAKLSDVFNRTSHRRMAQMVFTLLSPDINRSV